MLFGVNTPGGAWSVMIDWSSDLPQRWEEDSFYVLGLRHISGMAEARDLKFCVLVEGQGP